VPSSRERKREFRGVPAVHEVLDRLARSSARYPHARLVAEIRAVLDEMRAEILAGHSKGASAEERVARRLAALERLSLRRVNNATWVVRHTNLGRTPLGAWPPAAGYSNLVRSRGWTARQARFPYCRSLRSPLRRARDRRQ
jgi:L-seryl-tRNA(Ser) seleniumtransferase